MSNHSNALTNLTWRIAEARKRLERQREVVKLAEGWSTHPAAEALLRVIQRTLEQLEEDKRWLESAGGTPGRPLVGL